MLSTSGADGLRLTLSGLSSACLSDTFVLWNPALAFVLILPPQNHVCELQWQYRQDRQEVWSCVTALDRLTAILTDLQI